MFEHIQDNADKKKGMKKKEKVDASTYGHKSVEFGRIVLEILKKKEDKFEVIQPICNYHF